MEREFPKNVKQIGNVCDEPKIYVEDYVDTYLNQLKEKAEPAAVGAVLLHSPSCPRIVTKPSGVEVHAVSSGT